MQSIFISQNGSRHARRRDSSFSRHSWSISDAFISSFRRSGSIVVNEHCVRDDDESFFLLLLLCYCFLFICCYSRQLSARHRGKRSAARFNNCRSFLRLTNIVFETTNRVFFLIAYYYYAVLLFVYLLLFCVGCCATPRKETERR